MNSKQLECFIQVAEVLNFSTAARRLYITQPTVSHQIRSLEDELGVQLFTRTKRSISLTVAGDIFYKDAKEILTRENIAKTRVKNTQKHYDTKIAIAFSANSFEKKWLPPFIRSYNAKNPEVYLYFRKCDAKTGIQNILENKMDILLYTTKEIYHAKELSTREFYLGKFICLMSRKSALSTKHQIQIEDLTEQYLIIPEESVGTIELKQLVSYLQEKIPNILIYFCDDVDVSIMLVESGLGIALVPDFEVPTKTEISAIPLHLPDTINNTPYGLAWKNEKEASHQTLFIDELTDYMLSCHYK